MKLSTPKLPTTECASCQANNPEGVTLCFSCGGQLTASDKKLVTQQRPRRLTTQLRGSDLAQLRSRGRQSSAPQSIGRPPRARSPQAVTAPETPQATERAKAARQTMVGMPRPTSYPRAATGASGAQEVRYLTPAIPKAESSVVSGETRTRPRSDHPQGVDDRVGPSIVLTRRTERAALALNHAGPDADDAIDTIDAYVGDLPVGELEANDDAYEPSHSNLALWVILGLAVALSVGLVATTM